MSIRILTRYNDQHQVASGTDQVLCGISLPGDCTLNNVNLKLDFSASTVSSLGQQHGWAVEAWIVPVEDPDLGDTYDDLWDLLVPKDSDLDNVDLDTQAEDNTPFFEPGEPDWLQVFDIGLIPERVFERHGTMTYANHNGGYNLTSADAVQWLGRENFAVRLRKRYRVTVPSVFMLGMASPVFDDTTSAEPTSLAENEWNRTKYVGELLHQVTTRLLGLVQAGAETPYQEALDLVKKLIEPDVVEKTGGSYFAKTWHTSLSGIVDWSVPGLMDRITLTSGR